MVSLSLDEQCTPRLPPVLLVALGAGLVVRLARVARAPLIHPDGPAYLDLAAALLDGDIARVFGGYYSPLYPSAVAVLAGTGLPAELAGRLTATLASLASLPLLYAVARRLLGERAANAAALAGALHPELVKASAQVLPETLAGTCLLGWLAALLAARGPAGLALAGALGGATYLARPEGAFLVPLGFLQALGRQRATALAAYCVAALLVMAPALFALQARTGRWQLSPREERIAAKTGVPGETSLMGALRRDPGAFLRHTLAGGLKQTQYDAKALGPLLAIPFVVGLAVARPTRATGWPLAVVVLFTALPLALNPSPRYAVPLVPLLLPWVGAGLVAIGERIGRRAPVTAAILGVALVVQALWVSHPSDKVCWREVSSLVLDRYGPGQALVAVDGRFAYGARGRQIVPTSTGPKEALALAGEHGARLWLTRPRWIPPRWQPPPGVQAVARPCGGTFVLFELNAEQ